MKKYDRKIGSSTFRLSNRIDFDKRQENSAFEEKIVDFSKHPKENDEKRKILNKAILYASPHFHLSFGHNHGKFEVDL